MTSESDLASQLHKWAVEEMHFYSQATAGQKLPTVEDFKILCRGPNAAIWKWVVAHVRSAETVRTVKGNIALKSKTSGQTYKVKYGDKGDKYEQGKYDLLERRARITGEITTTLRDIGHLENDVNRIVSDVAETEHEYKKQLDSINNVRRKSALLHAFSVKSADTTAQYREYTRCIDSRVEDIQQRAQKSLETEEYYSKESVAGHDDTSDSAALETASSRNVRDCCESIGGFLHETLKGTFGGDKTEFARKKEPLWQKVEHVTGTFSPDQILNGLLANTRDTDTDLKDMTSRVNIRRDAQSLRFKYDPSGEMKDLSTPPSLLRSVHQLLQDRANEHLQRFIESQKYLNQTRNLEQSVTAIKGHLDKRLNKLFAQKNVDLQLARSLVETELQLEGYRASLHCLSSEADRLREIVEKSFNERQELFTKYHKIQEFQELTDKKQTVIQVLVKQNINSQSRMDAQIHEIEQYVERSLKHHQSQIEALSGKLQHCVNTEVKDFANLSLPYLMFSQIDSALKTAVLDLSIHQLSPSHVRPALHTVLQCLKFPSFQAPEMILRRCLTLKCEIDEVVDRLDREKWAQQWMTSRHEGQDVADLIAHLCDAMREEDEKQLSKTLPLLQHKLSKTGSALSDCLHAKDVAKAWWEQPGQSCVPWITVDGHNLQYYMDRWTILATNLRQVLVK